MAKNEEKQTWRSRVGWLAGQMFVIFLGVSAAFFVESYRETLSEKAELRQAIAGLVTELGHYEQRSPQLADGFKAENERWAAEDRAGRRAVPGHFRIPGAPYPPSAAWNTAVAAGILRLLDPKLRMELGYHYSEFLGIHENYNRYHQFTEREILPRLAEGPDAFYGPDGKLLPIFRVHMDLENEFAADLRRLAGEAHGLRVRLEALRSR